MVSSVAQTELVQSTKLCQTDVGAIFWEKFTDNWLHSANEENKERKEDAESVADVPLVSTTGLPTF